MLKNINTTKQGWRWQTGQLLRTTIPKGPSLGIQGTRHSTWCLRCPGEQHFQLYLHPQNADIVETYGRNLGLRSTRCQGYPQDVRVLV